jgi:hypothetical protein
MNNTRILQFSLALVIFAMAAFSTGASAQVPPRFYWKDLVGVNAVPVIFMDMSGNVNPLDPSHTVIPEASFDAQVAIGGYAHTFSAFGRSALAAALLPMGRVDASGSLLGRTFNESANGYGDPTLEFAINVVGPDPVMNIPDSLRYEPGFSLDLLVDFIVPIGEYDSSQIVNLGQNRWMVKVGTPIVWQIGDWVPGRRTTLDLLPALWFFEDNDDFGGQNLSTDSKFQLDGHLTRDFHENFWGSFDFTIVKGAEATIGQGQKGEEIDMTGLGFTLGYNINENIQLTAGYMASVSDDEPTDMNIDMFKISLVFGWHPLIEGMKRLSDE